jgi:KDO2-lipid IV(A) lauroyltransferase
VHYLSTVAPITVLYRPPRKQWLEEVIVNGRGQSGARMVPTDGRGVKALFSTLRRGEMVAILPDQQPKKAESKAGVFAPFFGVPALTMVLINRLAQKTGAAVVYGFAERLPHSKGFRLHWIEATEALADPDPVVAVTALNQGVEQCVRRCPEQYQWSYRRFEARPDGSRSPYSRNNRDKS